MASLQGYDPSISNSIVLIKTDDVVTPVILSEYLSNLSLGIDVVDNNVLTNYFTKAQTQNLLSGKADAATVYSAAETDDFLGIKADKVTTYTKGQTDTLLGLKSDKATTYTKTEVDTALGLKSDKVTTYTKTEVDTALGLKSDKVTTYTKTEVDTALGLKSDKATTYTKTEVDTSLGLKSDKATTYTKTEVDTSLGLKSDKATTYTKTEVDTSLNLKSDKATTYTKTETDTALNLKADKLTTYTKTEVDTSLNLKSDKATTYTISQVDTALATKVGLATNNVFTGSLTAQGLTTFQNTVLVDGANGLRIGGTTGVDANNATLRFWNNTTNEPVYSVYWNALNNKLEFGSANGKLLEFDTNANSIFYGNASFSGTLTSNSQAVVLNNDSRLTDSRTPSVNSVTNASIADNALSQSKINGLVTALANKQGTADLTLTLAGSLVGQNPSISWIVQNAEQWRLLSSSSDNNLYLQRASGGGVTNNLVFDVNSGSAWFSGAVTSAGDKAIDKVNPAFNFQQNGINRYQIKTNSTSQNLEINRGTDNTLAVEIQNNGTLRLAGNTLRIDGNDAPDAKDAVINFVNSATSLNRNQIRSNFTSGNLEINRAGGDIKVYEIINNDGTSIFHYDTEIRGHTRINFNDPQLHFQRASADKYIMGVDPADDSFFLYSQPNNTDTLKIIGNGVQVNSNMAVNGQLTINRVAADPDILFQTGGFDKFAVGVNHVDTALYVRRSGGSIALNVNINGIITKPVQPRAFVRWNSGTTQNVGTNISKMEPDLVVYNVGSLWSVANKRFECPVDGLYMITCTFTCNNRNHTNTVLASVRLNGTGVVFSTTLYYASINFTYYCTAGQYLELFASSSSATTALTNNEVHFSCCLLY